jgi:hypothetical protein
MAHAAKVLADLRKLARLWMFSAECMPARSFGGEHAMPAESMEHQKIPTSSHYLVSYQLSSSRGRCMLDQHSRALSCKILPLNQQEVPWLPGPWERPAHHKIAASQANRGKVAKVQPASISTWRLTSGLWAGDESAGSLTFNTL